MLSVICTWEWGLPNPIANNFELSSVLRGIRRALEDPVNRKTPVTPQLLLDIIGTLDITQPKHINFWASTLLMCFSLLRRSNALHQSPGTFDQSRNLRRRDLLFSQNGILIKMRQTKALQYRERVLEIPLPWIAGSPLCPVQAIFKAFRATPMHHPTERRLFWMT